MSIEQHKSQGLSSVDGQKDNHRGGPILPAPDDPKGGSGGGGGGRTMNPTSSSGSKRGGPTLPLSDDPKGGNGGG